MPTAVVFMCFTALSWVLLSCPGYDGSLPILTERECLTHDIWGFCTDEECDMNNEGNSLIGYCEGGKNCCAK